MDVLIVVVSVLLLLASAIAIALLAVRYWRGYRGLYSCLRIKASTKAAILRDMDDAERSSSEDEDFSSEDGSSRDEEFGARHGHPLRPNDSFDRLPVSAMTAAPAGSPSLETQQERQEQQKQQKQQQFLLQLPVELWLEVLKAAGPAHHHLVSALRESCRAMRRHLHGVAFWQCLSRQAFPSWAQWMVAVGWETPNGPIASETMVNSRAWQSRYAMCSRDRLLLRAAARQVTLTPPHGGGVVVPVTSYANGTGAGESDDAGAVRTDHGLDDGSGSGSDRGEGRSIEPADGGRESDDVERGESSGRGDGGASTASLARKAEPTAAAVADGGGAAALGGVLFEGGAHVCMRGFHVAELPSLSSSWAGRGPTQAQVAKALMRKHQRRIDTLLSSVAQSSHAQRRLVPVWKRVALAELPGLACALFGGPLSSSSTGAADPLAPPSFSAAPPSSAPTATSIVDVWFHRLHRIYALLAGGGAGTPECWVAHLAKGELRTPEGIGEAASRTSCWMMVVATKRHAVWLDYLHMQAEGW